MSRVPVSSTIDFNLPSDLNWVITSDPEFNQALDYIVHTSYNLFINGPAGTGKSVLIKLAFRLLSGSIMVLGSTGVSASRLTDEGVPASTIHCGLKIKPLDIFSKAYNPSDKNDVEGRNILAGTDIVIIEEVGMISASLFDHIGALIERAERKRRKPIRVICFGDVLQLPPVVKSSPEIRKYYKDRYRENIFFFNSDFYKLHKFIYVSLNTIYRQSDDSFQNILNRIRLDITEQKDLDNLNKNVIPLDEYKEKFPLSLILAPTVSAVRMLNQKYGIPKGAKKSMTYMAVSIGKFDWSDAGIVEPTVTIWEGQQVMCIHNEKGSFQNGTLCKVIQVFSDCIVAEKSNGVQILIKKHKWSQYEYEYNPITGKVEAKEIGAVVQIGCKPAAASTIHKAQGLTLESVYLYLQDGWIPPSGVYLGLSRCKTKENIGLSRRLFMKDISVLEEPMDFVIKNH